MSVYNTLKYSLKRLLQKKNALFIKIVKKKG